MTATQLVNTLNGMIGRGEIKESAKVLLSSDSEGNSYGTISDKSFGLTEKNNLIIYPWEERMDIDEID